MANGRGFDENSFGVAADGRLTLTCGDSHYSGMLSEEKSAELAMLILRRCNGLLISQDFIEQLESGGTILLDEGETE